VTRSNTAHRIVRMKQALRLRNNLAGMFLLMAKRRECNGGDDFRIATQKLPRLRSHWPSTYFVFHGWLFHTVLHVYFIMQLCRGGPPPPTAPPAARRASNFFLAVIRPHCTLQPRISDSDQQPHTASSGNVCDGSDESSHHQSHMSQNRQTGTAAEERGEEEESAPPSLSVASPRHYCNSVTNMLLLTPLGPSQQLRAPSLRAMRGLWRAALQRARDHRHCSAKGVGVTHLSAFGEDKDNDFCIMATSLPLPMSASDVAHPRRLLAARFKQLLSAVVMISLVAAFFIGAPSAISDGNDTANTSAVASNFTFDSGSRLPNKRGTSSASSGTFAARASMDPSRGCIYVRVGSRVARGRDWEWENQDGSYGNLGTVVSDLLHWDSDGWVEVEWDTISYSNWYRIATGSCDLRLSETRLNTITSGSLVYSTVTDVPINSQNVHAHSYYLPLPSGWSIAPDTAETRGVIKSYSWSTHVAVMGSGVGIRTTNFAPAGVEFGDSQPKFVSDSQGRVNCPWTSYQIVIVKRIANDLCPAGEISATGNAPCTKCPSGAYCSATGLKQPSGNCSAGSYSSGGAASAACTPCPQGSFCSAKGLKTPTGFCQQGTFSLQGSALCSNCTAGSFQDLAGQSACKPCTAGSFCSATSLSAPDGVCPPGSSSTSGASSPSCTPCPAGQLQPLSGQPTCAACPAGAFCSAAGLSAPTGNCSAGSYSSGSAASPSCTACPSGSFCPHPAMRAPTPCTAGSFCPSASLTAASPCTPGMYCERTGLTAVSGSCAAGSYSSGGAATSACMRCPLGQYQDTAAQSSCKACPAGAYCLNDEPIIILQGNTNGLRARWYRFSSSLSYLPSSSDFETRLPAFQNFVPNLNYGSVENFESGGLNSVSNGLLDYYAARFDGY
jgi:hypothetical protein